MNLLHAFVPHPNNKHKPIVTRHIGLTTILVFALTIQTTINTFYSTHPQVLGFATSIYQQELIELTNRQRTTNGLKPLQHNATLDEAARLKALDMFEEDYWAHISPSGTEPWHWFEVAGYEYQSAGENLARDFDTSSGVVAAWMASPTHRENILYSSFTEIGMAVVNGTLKDTETTLVVQLFGTPTSSQNLQLEPIVSEDANSELVFAQPTAIPPTPTSVPVPDTPTPTLISEPSVTVVVATPIDTITPTNIPTQAQTDTSFAGPIKNDATPPTRLVLALNIIKDLGNFSTNRLFSLGLIGTLILLFTIDTFVFARNNLRRENAHRLVHIGILVIALVGILFGATGAIL